MSITLEQIKIRHDLLVSVLDEKQYRLCLAAEAKSLGWGGMSQIAKVTHSSRNTISTGIEEFMKSADYASSQYSQNWRGRPLVSIETIVNLIGATKTKKGLFIQTSVDTNEYAKGTKVTDIEIQSLAMELHNIAATNCSCYYVMHPKSIGAVP